MYGCKNDIINADALEDFVFTKLKEKLLDTKNISVVINEINEIYSKYQESVQDTQKDTIKQLNKVEARINNYMKAIGDGLYNSEIKKQIEILEAEKETLRDLLVESDIRKNRKMINSLEIQKMISDELNNYENCLPSEKKKIIQKYINKIEVGSGKIVIYFNLSCLNKEDNQLTSIEKVLQNNNKDKKQNSHSIEGAGRPDQ